MVMAVNRSLHCAPLWRLQHTCMVLSFVQKTQTKTRFYFVPNSMTRLLWSPCAFSPVFTFQWKDRWQCQRLQSLLSRLRGLVARGANRCGMSAALSWLGNLSLANVEAFLFLPLCLIADFRTRQPRFPFGCADTRQSFCFCLTRHKLHGALFRLHMRSWLELATYVWIDVSCWEHFTWADRVSAQRQVN